MWQIDPTRWTYLPGSPSVKVYMRRYSSAPGMRGGTNMRKRGMSWS